MMFDGAFGAAGAEVVIEEFLSGREISFFALCDGETAIAAGHRAGPQAGVRSRRGAEHRRHGRLFADAVRDAEIHDQIMARIILPTVAGMKQRGMPFRGVLYAGVMLTAQGPNCSNTTSASAIPNARC